MGIESSKNPLGNQPPAEENLKTGAAEPDPTTEELEGMEPIGPEAGPDLTPETTGEETEVEKKKSFWEKTKAVLNNEEIGNQSTKTLISSTASVLGVKSLYDVPEYFRERFKVRGMFGKGKGLEGSMEELMAASQEGKERREKPTEEKEGEEEHSEVREAIKDLNGRLKLTKEGSEKGSEQRNLIAKMLRENRYKETTLKEDRHTEITKILDDYTTTKVTGIQAARESLNTLFVASGTFGLRGLSYGALAIAERGQRIKKEARQKDEKIESRELLKKVFIDGIKETYQGALFKGEGTGKQKAFRAIKSYGSIARFIGIAVGMKFSPGNYNIDKVLNTLEGKTSWGEMGNNFSDNFERIIDTPGRLKKFVGLGTGEVEAAEIETGVLSPDEKIAEAVEKAKGIQGLKQMVADKFGINVEGLKDVTGDGDVSNADITQIQSEKLGGFDIKEPLSAENFESLQGEKNLIIVQKILADGQSSETELNILKSQLPDKIKLALLSDSANQAENLENIQRIAAGNPKILEGLNEITGREGITRMAQIPKGGNISEVLGKAMAKDSAITVINPDGTKILDFDANLVHPGDTVIETGDGEICVLKTSGTEVEEGMSLEGIYDKIQDNLDKEGIPQEVQDYFNTNRAQGGWLGRIDAAEAKNAGEFWKQYGEKINKLTDDGKEEFYKNTNFNNPEEMEKQLTALAAEAAKEAEEGAEKKMIEDMVKFVEEETPEMKFFTGQENLDQKSFEKVIGEIIRKKLPLDLNHKMILGWSREISVLRNDLEKLELTPDQAQEKLNGIRDLMETSKNTYGTDVFNQDVKDFVNNYEIQEAPAAPAVEEAVGTPVARPTETPPPAEPQAPEKIIGTGAAPAEDFSVLNKDPMAEFPQNKLTFADSFPAEDKANYEKFFNTGLEERKEIIRQLDDWRERYGDKPQFAKFEAGVTEEVNLRNNLLENMAKEAAAGDSNNETIKVIQSQVGNLEPGTSARMILDHQSSLTGLQTTEEGAGDALKELDKEMDRVPPVEPLPPEKPETETPPAPKIEETPLTTPKEVGPEPAPAEKLTPEETPIQPEAKAGKTPPEVKPDETTRPSEEFEKIAKKPVADMTMEEKMKLVREGERIYTSETAQLMPEESQLSGQVHDKIVDFFENKKPQEGFLDQAKQEAINRSIKFESYEGATDHLDQSVVDEINRYNENTGAYSEAMDETSRLSEELADTDNNPAAQEALASFKEMATRGISGEEFKNIALDEESDEIYKKLERIGAETNDQKPTILYKALEVDQDSLVDKMKAEFGGKDIFDKKGEFKKGFLGFAGKNEQAKSLLDEYGGKNQAAAEYEKLAELYDKKESLRNGLLDSSKKISETAEGGDTWHITQEFIKDNFTGNEEVQKNFAEITRNVFKTGDENIQKLCFNRLIAQNRPAINYYLAEMKKGNSEKALEIISDYFRVGLRQNPLVKSGLPGTRATILNTWTSQNPFNPDKNYAQILGAK